MLGPLIAVLVCVYVLYAGIKSSLFKTLVVPSDDWRDKIQFVLDYPTPIYLNVGKRRSAFRRRLILASQQASFYTNFVNNKVKISPKDVASKKEFVGRMSDRAVDSPSRKKIYGFFHPYANNGGGGERVLWEAVFATLKNDSAIAAIYTTNTDAEPTQILSKVEEKFNIDLEPSRIVFIYLRKYGKYIDGNYWKRFTLIGQLLGSLLLAWEAIKELSPDVWVDTMGLPGSYLTVSILMKIPVLAYVHYPILQPDMFNKLKYKSVKDLKQVPSSLSDVKEVSKLFYWSALSYFYTYLGSLAHIVLANGTWTYNHLNTVWYSNNFIEILYPPCGTEHLVTPGESTRNDEFVYIAQFRPEKRHALILDEFKTFLDVASKNMIPINKIPTITFLGSCRTPDDTATLEEIKAQVKKLDLENYVDFLVDCPFSTVLSILSRAKYGLNAMWNEHFGIGVVEYISKGVIPVVHASAGPLLDIVRLREVQFDWHNELGFFFKSNQDPDYKGNDQDWLEFNIAGTGVKYPSLLKLLTELFISQPELTSNEHLDKMRQLGAEKMLEKFSNQAFDSQWVSCIEKLSALEEEFRLNRGKVEQVY